MAEIDDVVARLRAMVDERRRRGEYPEGLEHDLDQHFRRIVAYRTSTEVGDLEAQLAELDRRARFTVQRIELGSRAPGGEKIHRLVARVVGRQTEGVLAQLREFSDGVRDVLRTIAAVAQSPHGHVHSDLVGQLDAILERLAAYERGPVDSPAVVADLRRRVEELESWAPSHFRPWFDSSAFVDQFVGSREELVARYQDLGGLLRGCSPVLDVACGRGEVLEVLGAAEVGARGVDTDTELVEVAQARGLPASVGQGLRELAGAGDAALGGIVALRVLERWSPNEVLSFVSLAADKLRPGGRLVVEARDPQAASDPAHGAPADPTLRNATHPDYLSFLVGRAGFDSCRIDRRPPDFLLVGTR